MNNIIVNGKSIRVLGENISIINNQVYVDDKLIEEGLEGNVHITFEGDLASLVADGSVTVNGSVRGNVDTNGSVNCGDVEGMVSAGGSVNCEVVEGAVSAGGNISVGRWE